MDRNATIEAHYRARSEAMVNSLSRRLGWHDAEDVVQNAYLNALTYWDTYDPETSTVRTWFEAIFRNSILMHYRVNQIGELDLVALHDLLPLGATSPDRTVEVLQILSQMEDLRDDHTRALKMFFILGYSAPEIAQVLPLSVKNIETIVVRFRKSMRP